MDNLNHDKNGAAQALRRAMNGERTMERRPRYEHTEAEEGVLLLLSQSPAPTDGWSDGREAGQPPGCWRRFLATLLPVAYQSTLLLLVATGLAAQTLIFAQTDGLTEAFAGLMAYFSWFGGALAAGGLICAGLYLREREEEWARAEIPGGVATSAAGLALTAAALVISDLSASGAIPIP